MHRFCVVLPLAVLAAAFCLAGEITVPSFTLSPQQLKDLAGPVDSTNPAGVTVLLDEHNFQITSDNRVTERRHMIYRLDAASAIQGWSSAGCRWSPWYQGKPEVRARVVTPDGVVHELDSKTLSDAPAGDSRPEVFEADRVLSAPLPAVQIGAIVEEEETISDTRPFAASGFLRRVWVGRFAPVRLTRITVDAPASLPLHYTSQLVPQLSVRKEETNGEVEFSFEQGPMAALEEAPSHLPSDIAPYPYISLSTASSWQSVATEYDSIVEKQLAGDHSITPSPEASPADRLATIASVVAELHKQVRYTGLEFGDAGIVPRSPAATLQRHYGDCKDKAALLVAMLRAHHIPAQLALLNAGPGFDIDPTQPGMGLFDHAIVYVPGSPELWIDATAEYFPVGEFPAADHDRLALVISPATTALTRTPALTSEQNHSVELRTFILPEFGSARITELSQPGGQTAANYRAYYAESDSKKVKENLDSYVKEEYLAEALTNWEHAPAGDLTQPFHLKLEIEKGKRGSVGIDDAAAAIRVGSLFSGLPEALRSAPRKKDDTGNKPRTADLVFTPFVLEWRYRIVPPPAFRVRGLPPNGERAMGPARLSQHFETGNDGIVTGVIRFDTVKGRYTPAEVEAFRHTWQDIVDGEALMITFDHSGAALLREGKVRDALQVYRGLIAKHPHEALHHVQLANALLEAGLGEEARSEIEEAVRIDPTFAMAYRYKGWILQHDLIGRRFKKGFDLDGATAAYLKAEQLDPSDATAPTNLAILYEYDHNGERYSRDAHLDAAIEQYRLLEKVNEKVYKQFADNELYALAYDRRFAELKSQLAGLPQTETHLALLLASIAGSDGPAAALKQSDQLASEASTRSSALAIAGAILTRLRMYSAAADLVQASAADNADGAEILSRAQALRGTRPYEQVLYPASDPRSEVQRYYLTLSDPAAATPQAAAEFSDVVRAFQARFHLFSLVRRGDEFRLELARYGDERTVALDIFLSHLNMTVEGNDHLGYRIRQRTLRGDSMTAFVSHFDGKFRLVGIDPTYNHIGIVALNFLKEGDLQSAHQWLEWAREIVTLPGGDDPIAWPIFAHFWNRGDPADPNRMKLAAISLGANTEAVKPYLADFRQMASTLPPDRQPESDMILLYMVKKAEDWQQSHAIAARILQADPASAVAFESLWGACIHMHDWPCAQAAVDARLRVAPDDTEALELRANNFEYLNQIEKARAIYKDLLDRGKGGSSDLNDFSWDALALGKVEETDIQAAQQAAAMSQNTEYNTLQTLASLYAEVGKTKEARDIVLHTLDVTGLEEPDAALWYVLARIDEQYGETTAALEAYHRINMEDFGDNPSPSSTSALIKKRLAGLANHGAPQSAAR